jgi:outer membrane protein TolC
LNGYNLGAGPAITWPLFQGGAIEQNIKLQSALQQETLANYKSVVLNALEETENALVSYADEQNRLNDLQQAVLAAESAANLAENEYQAGLTDFTSVLDAQRSLLSFQDQLAQSQGAVTSNLIRIYKALGGGWRSYAMQNDGEIKGVPNGK